MDKITKKNRSWNMSRIRSKNTTPELIIRKLLHGKGLRYRLHYNLPGKPDIAFVTKKIAIFIHGCFWHGHKCKNNHLPKTNTKFWLNKVLLNKIRDKKNVVVLSKMKWKVVVMWECQINKNATREFNKLRKIVKYSAL